MYFRNLLREDKFTEGQWRSGTVLYLQFVITLKLYQLRQQRGKGFVHKEVNRGDEQLRVRSQLPHTCETRDKFLQQSGDNTNTCSAPCHQVHKPQ